MALIIETGAGVSGANSYISTTDAQAYLDERGLSVTLTDGLLLRAMDRLSGFRWNGYKTTSANPLSWPRSSVLDCEGEYIDNDAIPDQLKEAQIWLAHFELSNDPSALPTPAISSEKVDVLSVSYAVRTGDTTAINPLNLPNVKSRLKCLINTSGGIDRA